MNTGSFLIEKNFFDQDKISAIRELALDLESKKTSVHDSGKYGDIQWHKIELDPEIHPFMNDIYSFLGASKDGICVFYYLSPGAILHPHRDLTGASSNARIRFHVPIITNDKVFFNVSKKRVVMGPGELWALDTWRRQKLSATPDLSGRVLPCLITNSALKNAPISRSVCCVA